MKMKPMLKYIFSLLTVVVFAQNSDTLAVKNPDTIRSKERYTLRFGADLHRLSKSFYDDDYKGLELVGDLRLTKKFYAAVEVGSEKKFKDDVQVDYTTQGTYLKVGFDFNSYENWLDMKNVVSIGLRYGMSRFSQELHSYKIYQSSNYYGENTYTPDAKFSGLSAGWLEVVGSVKAELFHNLFLGFSLRLNYLLHEEKPTNFENLYIPGYNKTYDGKYGAGFNYTLTYMLPLFRMK